MSVSVSRERRIQEPTPDRIMSIRWATWFMGLPQDWILVFIILVFHNFIILVFRISEFQHTHFTFFQLMEGLIVPLFSLRDVSGEAVISQEAEIVQDPTMHKMTCVAKKSGEWNYVELMGCASSAAPLRWYQICQTLVMIPPRAAVLFPREASADLHSFLDSHRSFFRRPALLRLSELLASGRLSVIFSSDPWDDFVWVAFASIISRSDLVSKLWMTHNEMQHFDLRNLLVRHRSLWVTRKRAVRTDDHEPSESESVRVKLTEELKMYESKLSSCRSRIADYWSHVKTETNKTTPCSLKVLRLARDIHDLTTMESKLRVRICLIKMNLEKENE